MYTASLVPRPIPSFQYYMLKKLGGGPGDEAIHSNNNNTTALPHHDRADTRQLVIEMASLVDVTRLEGYL